MSSLVRPSSSSRRFAPPILASPAHPLGLGQTHPCQGREQDLVLRAPVGARALDGQLPHVVREGPELERHRAGVALVEDEQVDHRRRRQEAPVAPPIGPRAVEQAEQGEQDRVLFFDGLGQHAPHQARRRVGPLDPPAHVGEAIARAPRQAVEAHTAEGREGQQRLVEHLERVTEAHLVGRGQSVEGRARVVQRPQRVVGDAIARRHGDPPRLGEHVAQAPRRTLGDEEGDDLPLEGLDVVVLRSAQLDLQLRVDRQGVHEGRQDRRARGGVCRPRAGWPARGAGARWRRPARRSARARRGRRRRGSAGRRRRGRPTARAPTSAAGSSG